MRLAILVTCCRHLPQVCGIAQAAAGKGHAVAIFATGEGTAVLADPRFWALAALPGVTAAYCEHSAQRHGGRPAGLPAAVAAGNQFDNAVMISGADKVIVL
jgi:hypothetical protein